MSGAVLFLVLSERLAGALLGIALGDALGLPTEGMSARAIARRFGRVDRFHLLGRTGFVSDDTEQSALVAQSLIRAPADVDHCVRLFRRSLLGWFLRLPWGLGLATLRACLRMLCGLKRTGVSSAGNGAAMRAAVIGAFLHDQPDQRRAYTTAISQVTHVDDRAVQGAVYVAEVAAAAVHASSADAETLVGCHDAARAVIDEPVLGDALDRARDLATGGVPVPEAAQTVGTTGYVVHSVPFGAYCFMRFGDHPLEALSEIVAAGGDTDTVGAMVGGWVGALHGEAGLPADLLTRIHDGPFGPTHLRALAMGLARVAKGELAEPPPYSVVGAMARNLLLYPVVLAHGFRRLLPS